MISQLLPNAVQPYFTNNDEFWRERRAISVCLQTAGIYGEDASRIEYETLIKLGIVHRSPCERSNHNV